LFPWSLLFSNDFWYPLFRAAILGQWFLGRADAFVACAERDVRVACAEWDVRVACAEWDVSLVCVEWDVSLVCAKRISLCV